MMAAKSGTMNFDTDSLLDKVGDGEVYLVNHSATISGGGSTNLHIRNPIGSGSIMWVADVDVVTGGRSSFVKLHDAFASITDGSAITIQNAELGTEALPPDEGPFEAHADSTFTAEADSTIPIGVAESNQIDTTTLTTHLMLVRQGRELVIEVENTGSSDLQAIIATYLIA